jgi:hypothetical protein
VAWRTLVYETVSGHVTTRSYPLITLHTTHHTSQIARTYITFDSTRPTHPSRLQFPSSSAHPERESLQHSTERFSGPATLSIFNPDLGLGFGIPPGVEVLDLEQANHLASANGRFFGWQSNRSNPLRPELPSQRQTRS